MKFSRNAALAATALIALVAAAPAIVNADDQQHSDKQRSEKHKNWNETGKKDQGGEQPEGQTRQRGEARHQQGNKREKQGKPEFGQQPATPGTMQKKQFGTGGGGNPNAFVKPNGMQPQKAPAVNNAVVPKVVPPQNAGQQKFDNGFGGHKDKNKYQKQFGQDRLPGKATAPTAGNPPITNKPAATTFAPLRKPLPAAEAKKRFEALRGQRKQVKIDGGKGVVIEEPGKRRIIKENNRVMITHDDTERLRRVAPNAHFTKGKGGTTIAVIDRPGGYKIYSETDANGQLIRRYRRGPDGRNFTIIDNRRRRHDNFGRNLAAGIGIGVGVVAGAAILNSVLDVPPPRVTIPRDRYIVDYDGASDEDVYEALSAPPVDDFRDRYTLDEIRATAALRDRMRRVDLDDITFDFGSWEVNPTEYGKLDRIARAMQRIIRRNPDEVFMIEGYTDAVGSPEDNLSLSDRRAESVAEVLTEQFQIPFENLTTQGYGEEYLKVPTQAPERLNRRVAVRRITPLLARDNGPPPSPSGARQQPDYDYGPGEQDDGGPDSGGPDGGQD